nr:immunoglobulin heavy chain junction region [Macaca mulatta]MOV50292.1 immunoglobulin heavy chain junction region [Macaca mulatta]MOV52115.1 immunoglobulin heavy chain junction region [Macaca mulatta]MOV52153.1 immunoglobulin heavy chain junction region [Macaca mulatta]
CARDRSFWSGYSREVYW